MLKKIIPVLSRLNKSLISNLIILTCVWLPTTRASDKLLLDKVIATVNKELILHSDLEEACKQLALEGKVVNESMKMYVLRELVLNKIFLAKAKLHDVKIPKTSIERACDDRMANLVQRFGSEAKLVQAAHQSIYDIKKSVKQRVKSEYLVSWVHQHLTENVVVTPADVKAYFNALPPHNRPYYPASVKVCELVVYPKVNPAREAAVKSKLLSIKQSVLNGLVTFAESAKEYSDDIHSAVKGGEIGWVRLGVLAPAYESAALALKIGEISDPIVSEFGWHLIQLTGRNKDQYNTRHILKVLTPTEEEISLAQVELNKIRTKIITGTLTFEAAVQQYSEDKETVARGGVIRYNQPEEVLPGQLIPVESLDPDLFFAIDALEVGGVSQPHYMAGVYQPAWRLFYLKQKVDAHPMNLTQDYEKIHDYLLQQKKKEAIDKWIQTAKSECVVSFSPAYETVEKLIGLS